MPRILTAPGILFLVAMLLPPALADSPKALAFLEVRLPAEARLEIDGTPTNSTGNTRVYRTPPLAIDKTYTYSIKVTWQGKQAVRTVSVQAERTALVEFTAADFAAAAAAAEVKDPPAKEAPPVRASAEPAPKPAAKAPPTRDGFLLKEEDGRWWVFKAGSKELAEFAKNGELAKHVIRVNAAPYGVTVKAPDVGTLEEYLTAKPGYLTKYEDGRLWVFKVNSKEWDEFSKQGELTKHVTRIGAGPRGMTLKAPDAETIDAYVKATVD